jgi:LDH2 family malate/lactate/ureidoglycolate dehydrogenase
MPAAALQAWTAELLAAAGLDRAGAQTVAEALVDASLRGTDSHGVARVPTYAERLLSGAMNPAPRPRVEREAGAVAVVDGDRGPGQVAGVFATERSVALAREHGVGAVAVRRSNHIGAAGFYAIRAARAGCVGFATTNADPYVVPFGGLRAALGTNPIAFAAPAGDGILDVDMATSQVAVNRVFNARDEGREIPPDWGVDAEGRPTTDPAAVAAVVPLGGYKGTGLGVMVEVLSGVLTGAALTGQVAALHSATDRPQDLGHFHLALDPEAFGGLAAFRERLAGLLAELKAVPPAAARGEVLLPGEPEARERARREREGVPLTAAVSEALRRLSRRLGVAAPDGG